MAKKLIIGGRVQGVFCRNYCSQYARKMGLGGSASNLHDGTVRVILSTDDDELIKEYIHFLKTNPYDYTFYGRIERVDVFDYSGPVSGDYVF